MADTHWEKAVFFFSQTQEPLLCVSGNRFNFASQIDVILLVNAKISSVLRSFLSITPPLAIIPNVCHSHPACFSAVRRALMEAARVPFICKLVV